MLKQLITILFISCITHYTGYSQTNLEVEGRIKVSEQSKAPVEGEIRFFEGDFQGYVNNEWCSLTTKLEMKKSCSGYEVYINDIAFYPAEQTDLSGLDYYSECNCTDGIDNDGNGLIDSADPFCTKRIDLCLDKQVFADGHLYFQIIISNDGPDEASGIKVKDFVPDGIRNIHSISEGGQIIGNEIMWSDLYIPPSETLFLNFEALVNPGGNNFINIAEVIAHNEIDIDSTPKNGADTDGDGIIGSCGDDSTQDPDDEDDGDDAEICEIAECNCADGIDNDNDGAIDNADTDCMEICNDGIDNNGNGSIDCNDFYWCDNHPCCNTPTSECDCTDGLDNDGDGDFDCDDSDCQIIMECDCFDGLDNDGDGAIDCDDPDCLCN